jgi:hypothetical protein
MAPLSPSLARDPGLRFESIRFAPGGKVPLRTGRARVAPRLCLDRMRFQGDEPVRIGKSLTLMRTSFEHFHSATGRQAETGNLR